MSLEGLDKYNNLNFIVYKLFVDIFDFSFKLLFLIWYGYLLLLWLYVVEFIKEIKFKMYLMLIV